MSFSGFFGLTGLHGLSVTFEVVMLAIVFGRPLAGQFTPERHTAVATVSTYRHSVDTVWIFLVVVPYVGAVSGRQLRGRQRLPRLGRPSPCGDASGRCR